jgi:hypothetical protein
MINSSGPKSSIKGFRIRWNKKLKLSQIQKRQLKKDLHDMSERILHAMNCAKDEGFRHEIAEMRLPLPAHAHLHAYLTIEYCDDAWHLILETYNDCLGEVVCPDSTCIQMLENSEVEEEFLE